MADLGGPKGGPPLRPERGKPDDRGSWAYVHLGTQLTVMVAAGVGAGYWLDRSYGWTPWGVVTGGVLGTGLGLYYFLKETL